MVTHKTVVILKKQQQQKKTNYECDVSTKPEAEKFGFYHVLPSSKVRFSTPGLNGPGPTLV